ncbi:EamA-like transporter family protein [compost metagenome]
MVWLARHWLGETVSRAQWTVVGLGFVGMLLVVRPGGSLPLQGTLLMLLAAACYAVFQLLTRRLAGQVPGPIQFAHMAWVCLLVTAFPGWLAWPLIWPTAAQWPVLVAGSLASGLGQLLMLAAYQRASASTLGPLNYLQLLMAVAISSFWFGAVPDAWALAGMALIGSAGLYLALRRP